MDTARPDVPPPPQETFGGGRAGRGQGCYRLLETVRQYGREQLEARGEAARVRERHLGWCAGLAEEAELRLAGALWCFWETRGYFSEGRSWLEAALADAGSGAPLARAKALNGAGNLAYAQGDLVRAEALYEEALALARELGHTHAVASVLTNLGNVRSLQGDLVRAAALHEQALALRRELGSSFFMIGSLRNLVELAYRQGEYERAAALLEELLALAQELGAKHGVAYTLSDLRVMVLGIVAHLQGDLGRAALHREALLLGRDFGAKDVVAASLEGLSWVAAARGQPDQAARLGGAAEALRDTLGLPLAPEQRAGHNQAVQAVRDALGEEAFAAAWAAGRTLPLEEAIALALEGHAVVE
jgi:non-specific serine/threonine protein kinase